MGRFLTEDTVSALYDEMPNGQEIDDPLSLNLYTYGHNNPIRYTDPSGNAVTDWDREHLTTNELQWLQGITDAWSSGTAAQQSAWRLEANVIRSKYRMPYEYTDYNGITKVDTNKLAEYEDLNKAKPYKNLAVAAGGIALVDSPAPGPADLVAAGGLVVGSIYIWAKTNSASDPYARPEQKKQGREVKEKKKADDKDWESNPNKRKAPPKKHSPSKKGHRKY